MEDNLFTGKRDRLKSAAQALHKKNANPRHKIIVGGSATYRQSGKKATGLTTLPSQHTFHRIEASRELQYGGPTSIPTP
jgi:hypothetical protein